MENIEDLAGFDMAAVIAVMDGKFSEKIAQLKTERAKLDEKYATLRTLEEAKKVKEEADQFSAEIIASANARLQIAVSKENEISNRESQVKAGRKSISDDQRSIDSQKAMLLNLKSQLDGWEQKNKSMEQNLAEREAKLVTDRALLEADKQMFNQKLAALKV